MNGHMAVAWMSKILADLLKQQSPSFISVATSIFLCTNPTTESDNNTPLYLIISRSRKACI